MPATEDQRKPCTQARGVSDKVLCKAVIARNVAKRNDEAIQNVRLYHWFASHDAWASRLQADALAMTRVESYLDIRRIGREHGTRMKLDIHSVDWRLMVAFLESCPDAPIPKNANDACFTLKMSSLERKRREILFWLIFLVCFFVLPAAIIAIPEIGLFVLLIIADIISCIVSMRMTSIDPRLAPAFKRRLRTLRDTFGVNVYSPMEVMREQVSRRIRLTKDEAMRLDGSQEKFSWEDYKRAEKCLMGECDLACEMGLLSSELEREVFSALHNSESKT